MPRFCVVLLVMLLAEHGVAAPQPLRVSPAPPRCGLHAGGIDPRETGTAHSIPDSQVASGGRDIRRAWLGSPTNRYAHAALGSRTHAASLHVLAATAAGDRELSLQLPDDRVFEDRLVRLADLDGDGRDEIIVVEAQEAKGAALVVFSVQGPAAAPRLVERARSPHVGSMRWLNPVGVADFDGDGKLELVSVTTPHIGGVLTLYRYDPPRLVPLAGEGNVSNHRMGAVEQRLAIILASPGAAPSVLVPDQSRRVLRRLGWSRDGAWRLLAASVPLPAAVERIEPHRDGACLQLDGGGWLRVLH